MSLDGDASENVRVERLCVSHGSAMTSPERLVKAPISTTSENLMRTNS